MTRGSTLIYHSNKTLAPGRTFPTPTPSGLPADDPGSLMVWSLLLFPFTAIFIYGILPSQPYLCQDLVLQKYTFP